MYSQKSLNHICINNIPRLLNLIDQNPFSNTYGCFDRNFWHYKIAKDFPSATYQQGVLSLAIIYKYNLKNNPYYQDKKIIDLISAAINYWQKIQHRDGSFSEWYPNERSYVATSFTSFAISETLLILKNVLAKKLLEKTINHLEKSYYYLKKQNELFVANHIAADLPFFYNLYLLTKKDKYLLNINNKLKDLKNMHNPEGWFKEYNGADLGYQTLSIYFLSKYYQKSQNNNIKPLLNSALNFTSYFLHPDGSFGGEYGSRNTTYFLPAGFAILSKSNKIASNIFSWWQKNHPINLPLVSDDRYFCFFYLPNYLETLIQNTKASHTNKSFNYLKNFNKAKILVINNKKYYAVIGSNKNGVIKIFSQDQKSKLIFSDVGYFAKLPNQKIITSQFINPRAKISTKINKDTAIIKIITNLAYIDNISSSPLIFLFLRIFNLTIGRTNFFSNLLSNTLKKTKIANKSFSNTKLKRTITLEKDLVNIKDNIYLNNFFTKFATLSSGSLLFVPSSKISPIPTFPILNIDLTEISKRKQFLTIKQTINFTSNKPKTTCQISH